MSRAHIRVPVALERDPAVPANAQRLWRLLDDECREWSGVRRTRGYLADRLGCSEDAIKKWRRALVAAGWLAHEAAGNRGEVSGWVPLRRARPVLHQGWKPVDNPAGRGDGRGDSRTPFYQGKGGQPSPLDAAATRTRTAQQNAAPAWCGHCDSPEYRFLVDEECRPICPCPHCGAGSDREPAF